MTRRPLKSNFRGFFAGVVVVTALSVLLTACVIQPNPRKPQPSLFIGVDASGSFYRSGHYEGALAFLAHYIYGHLKGLDGMSRPRALFVGSIGGNSIGEPKAFHPIHDFQGKDVRQIEEDLRAWFPPGDKMTDFNAFFAQVSRIAQERNLTLSPITVMVVSDGVPDVSTAARQAGSKAVYEKIDLSSMEYLSRNLTLRLAYASPKVGNYWRKHIPRRRVRMWTVDAEIMQSWQKQIEPETELSQQHRLWKWIQDTVDYRVRARRIV